MADNDNDVDWENATWKGARRAQLRRSLKLTPRQRFGALEDLAQTAQWLAGAGGKPAEQKRGQVDELTTVKEPTAGYLLDKDGQPSNE